MSAPAMSRFVVFPFHITPRYQTVRPLTNFTRAVRLRSHASLEEFFGTRASDHRFAMKKAIRSGDEQLARLYASLAFRAGRNARRHAHAASKFLWSFSPSIFDKAA